MRTARLRTGDLAVLLMVAALGCETSEGGNAPVTRSDVPTDTPLVAMETSAGRVVLELYPWLAPVSVDNFLGYVEEGFYDGLVFHRVVSEFVIQAGGYDSLMRPRQTHGVIRNESDNGLHNVRGTIAMARFPDPHSASSQFYINVFDNRPLDHKGTPEGWGYAVFGRVRSGIDVVDSISMVKTGVVAGMEDVPIEPVTIDSIRLVEE